MGWFAYLALLGAMAGADAPDLAETLFGPADCTAVTGNGGLTVGVNAYGRVTTCRWPSPGHHDQLGTPPPPGDESEGPNGLSGGVMWGFRVDGTTHWLAAPPFTTTQAYEHSGSLVINTTAKLPESAGQVTQTTFVHPERDILAMRLTLEGFSTPPEVYWYGDFSPCTRLVQQLPVADWAFDGLNDFAVFTDPIAKRTHHFRPALPGLYEWEFAKELTQVNAKTKAWARLGDGVWISFATADGAGTVHCGSEKGPDSLLAQANAGSLRGAGSAVGQCASLLAVTPGPSSDGTVQVTVFAAFAGSKIDADMALAQAHKSGFDQLRQETEEYWWNWLKSVTLPPVTADFLDRGRRCLLHLAVATDRQTGGIARAPISRPPLALDWPCYGAWITHALDSAGLRDEASRHSAFYLDAVRTEAVAPSPLGSLPWACYTDGMEAAPATLVDTEGTAAVLWSIWNHSRLLPPEQQTAYLAECWDRLDLMGSFLAGRVDSRTGEPLHSFTAHRMRDSRSDELLVSLYTGLDRAVRIARLLGHARPHWETRLQQLGPLLRYRSLGPEGSWKAQQPLALWPTGIIPPRDPRWEPALEQQLERIDQIQGIEKARVLYLAALCLRENPEWFPKMRVPYIRALRSVMPEGKWTVSGIGPPEAFPDAARSALYYAAALAFCDAEKAYREGDGS